MNKLLGIKMQAKKQRRTTLAYLRHFCIRNKSGTLELLVNEHLNVLVNVQLQMVARQGSFTCVNAYPLSPPRSSWSYGQGCSYLYYRRASGIFKGCFTALQLWSRECFTASLVWSRFMRSSWVPARWCGAGRERMLNHTLLSAVESSVTWYSSLCNSSILLRTVPCVGMSLSDCF